jgi:hypothetical protein
MAVHQLIGRRSVLFSGGWRLGRMHEFRSRRLFHRRGPVLPRRAERNVADHVLIRRIWMRARGNNLRSASAEVIE